MPRLKTGDKWVIIDEVDGEKNLWSKTGLVPIHTSLQRAKDQVESINKIRIRARRLTSGVAKGTAKVARADEWAAEITARAILGQVREV